MFFCVHHVPLGGICCCCSQEFFALFWLRFFRRSASYHPFPSTRALHTTRNTGVRGNAVSNKEWQYQILAKKNHNSEGLAKTECRRLQQDNSHSLRLSNKNTDTQRRTGQLLQDNRLQISSFLSCISLERLTKSLKWEQEIERIEFCADTTLMVHCKHTAIHGPQGKRSQEVSSL